MAGRALRTVRVADPVAARRAAAIAWAAGPERILTYPRHAGIVRANVGIDTVRIGAANGHAVDGAVGLVLSSFAG